MNEKDKVLTYIRESLDAGVITGDDLRQFIATEQSHSVQASESAPSVSQQATKLGRLSAVDIIFNIAGIVLYAAVASIIFQVGEEGGFVFRLMLSLGIGVGLWAIARYLIGSPYTSDIRKGLVNASLLTGSLSIITSGYIIAGSLMDVFEGSGLIMSGIMLAVVGLFHLAFDRMVKRDFTMLMGILLCVASFPVILFGLLQEYILSFDIPAVILIATSGLLVYAARVSARLNPQRVNIASAFDSFAAFVALASMYCATFSDYGGLWFVVLAVSIFGIFYLSIISQDRRMLGAASFFLVLMVMTLSFKYFSGFGVTVSLIVSTFGLLTSAAVATSINRKYFRRPSATIANSPGGQSTE